VAGTFGVFLLARAVQGAGAGAVYPNAQAEGIAQFPPERRGTALGIFGAVFGVATIIGPNVGGALAQFLGWRWIFLVNLPLIVGALLMARRLPEGRPATRRAMPDFVGGLAFAAGLAALLLCLAVPGAWRLACAAAAAGLGGLFVARQRASRAPFLDTAPLRNRSGPALVGGAAIIGMGMSAAIFVPSLAQARLGFGVFASGAALMPAAVSGAVLAAAGGVLVDRRGARLILQVGLLAGVAGGLLLGRQHLGLLGFILAMLCFGLATAFTMGAPLNRMALALYRDEQAGEALALAAVFRSVGLAAGPVILTLALAHGGFPAMFHTVAVASLVGAALFLAVPDVRPAAAVARIAG